MKLPEQGQSSERRRAMLTSIRQQLAASAPYDAVRKEHEAKHQKMPSRSATIPYELPTPSSIVESFRQSLDAVGGQSIVARSEMEAAQAVQEIIVKMKAQRVAVSDSPLVRRVIERVRSTAELLENIAGLDLFDCDVGLTGAQFGVAETGTLVMDSEQERHRLSSLLPPVHVVLMEAQSIRHTLDEVLQSLSKKGKNELSRTVTFITGASRTSDIELNLTIGVHGPGEVYVIVVENEATRQ
jgi:L-lactate dehydrogenase complex protein LldG